MLYNATRYTVFPLILPWRIVFSISIFLNLASFKLVFLRARWNKIFELAHPIIITAKQTRNDIILRPTVRVRLLVRYDMQNYSLRKKFFEGILFAYLRFKDIAYTRTVYCTCAFCFGASLLCVAKFKETFLDLINFQKFCNTVTEFVLSEVHSDL